jgi:hypothetical protein
MLAAVIPPVFLSVATCLMALSAACEWLCAAGPLEATVASGQGWRVCDSEAEHFVICFQGIFGACELGSLLVARVV